MQSSNGKTLAAIFLAILFFVMVSGCSDMYGTLKTYVPTPSPTSQAIVKIGDVAPQSAVKGVTITGQGNTIVIRGRGPYNVQSYQDYFTLNKGSASINIDLKGAGFGCSVNLCYKNPYTGGTEYLPVHQFTTESREYQVVKQVSVPYGCKYCLMVNWGGDWEIRITQ